MRKINSLNDIVSFNSDFKSAVNLYLSLNKPEKVLGYIPTQSSVRLLEDYAQAIVGNKEQATILVGPYGKGKSHLLLVLLAILSMPRSKENKEIIKQLVGRIKKTEEVGKTTAELIERIWKGKRYLPVLLTDTTGDLNQTFLYGLNDALKREGLVDLVPDTYYSIALDRIQDWKKDYPDTFSAFEKELKEAKTSTSKLSAGLKMYSKDALDLFKSVYPKVTAGSEFNPMAVSDVLPLYKSTSEKLVEDYDYDGIFVVFDEFSKFIESQNGEKVGNNMKLLQDLCELATDSKNAKVFFTMVTHKSIKEYGKYLSQEIINAFTGIEGRIIEKFFVTSSKNNYELVRDAILKDEKQLESIPHYDSLLGKTALSNYYRLPAFKSKFVEKEFESIILKGCYPLNPVATYLLMNVSEKVAQNERTLFTFISNDEPNSMARFILNHSCDMEWSVGADLIYDYFSPLFKKDVVNEYAHNIWLSSEYAIEKSETEDQKKIIKALAVVLIVNKEDELPASNQVLSLCVTADDSAQAIHELIENNQIYKKSSTGCFVFKTRAGSELKSEIKRQRELKGDNVNYGQALLDVTGQYYVVPRKYNTINMMTRYFVHQFMEVEDFLQIDSAETFLRDCKGDGKVISLFGFDGIKQEVVRKHFADMANPRIIVVCPKKAIKAQKQLKDYVIIQELKDNQAFTANNEILKKELPLMIEDISADLESKVSEVYEDADTKVFYYDGKVKNAKSGNEELAVNNACENVYFKTPVINNEMINRTVLSSAQTRKARINVIESILHQEDPSLFAEGTSQEATMYRSLFCVTGIMSGTPKPFFEDLLNLINEFVDSCSDQKTSLSELILKLTSAPYGVRLGVVPFYLAYVLANRNEDIIVYFVNKEIQVSADVLVNMCEQPEEYSVYVSKEDLQKEKYISELNLLFQVEENRNLSANRIKNIFVCMQRWFRALPQVSRNAAELSRYVDKDQMKSAMKEIKKVIQKVEFNPFETLFIDFPNVFKTDSLKKTFSIIDDCKTLYDDYFEWMQNQAALAIYEVWGGRKNKDLYHCLRDWYEKQSRRSKQGLYNGHVSSFMSMIENLDVFSDQEVARKTVRAVMDVYIENWDTGSLDEFAEELKSIKSEIEAIKDEAVAGEMTLTFTKRNGEVFEKTYSYAPEGTGSVLRNIIEDTLEEYEDVSVNDRVSILLEMIEKITR